MEIVYIAVGLIIGFFVAYLVVNLKSGSSENKLLEIRNEYGKIQAQLDERVNNLQTENARLLNQLDEVAMVKDQQMQQLAKAEAEFENLREKLVTQKQEMEDLQKKFTTEFENIANKILEKNSEKFTAANQKNMGDVLNPLKEKIELFERKVEDTYKQGLKDQTDLRDRKSVV